MLDQLEEIQTEFGTINIFKNRTTGTVRYELAGWRQSVADSDGISLASYIHALFGLVSQAKSRTVLIIGGAGGTLATMLARKGHKPVIVDVNPASFALARRYFQLPETVACHAADGEAFLRTGTETYDAVVIDAFHGQHIPEHLQTAEFFGTLRGRLTPQGAVFINVHVNNDLDDFADRLARTMEEVWRDVRLLDAHGPKDRNAVVMAGEVSRLRPPRLLMVPAANASGIKSELAQLRFRAVKESPRDLRG